MNNIKRVENLLTEYFNTEVKLRFYRGKQPIEPNYGRIVMPDMESQELSFINVSKASFLEADMVTLSILKRYFKNDIPKSIVLDDFLTIEYDVTDSLSKFELYAYEKPFSERLLSVIKQGSGYYRDSISRFTVVYDGMGCGYFVLDSNKNGAGYNSSLGFKIGDNGSLEWLERWGKKVTKDFITRKLITKNLKRM